MRILFVTWDGPTTAYLESLFLPLLAEARRPEDEIAVLQFTWDAEARSQRIHEQARRLGIEYSCKTWERQLRTFETPMAIWRGGQEIVRRVRQRNIDVVLARSILPGAMTQLARRTARWKFHFIYDADGLPADERVEFAGWSPNGAKYRTFRWLDRSSVKAADQVLVRTPQAVEILSKRASVSPERFRVVTNGKDSLMYHPATDEQRTQTRAELGIAVEAPVLVYVGSVGPQYRLPDMVRLFDAVRAQRDDTTFLVLTSSRNHRNVHNVLNRNGSGRAIVLEADPSDVPRYLAVGDLGLALRSPTLSQRAVAPIKVAEYLLCGVPVVYTPGVGNLDDLLTPDIAFAMDGNEAPGAAAEWLVGHVLPSRPDKRCDARDRGMGAFSLAKGAADYASAFAQASHAPTRSRRHRARPEGPAEDERRRKGRSR